MTTSMVFNTGIFRDYDPLRYPLVAVDPCIYRFTHRLFLLHRYRGKK